MQLDHDNALNLTVQDVVAKRIAVLGASGFGKTNTVARLVEQLLPQMPITILDPHEDYYGLREKFPILIAGKGLHTDIPLDVEHAPALAEYSFANRLSVILDMLLMDEDERTEIVVAYCQALWQCAIKAEVRLPYGVVIDEAHNFIPEGGRDSAATKRMKQFASEGRKFGIGMILSTQRAAAISKAVLANCEMLFLHGVSIENDVRAYQSVLPYDFAETKRIAYALEQGEALFRQARRVERVRILKRDTFHAGDTPTLGDAPAPVMQQIDAALLDSLKAALKTTAVERGISATPPIVDTATTDTLDALKRELDALRAESAAKDKQLADHADRSAKLLRLEQDLKTAKGELERTREHAERLQARLNKQREKPELEPVQETLIGAHVGTSDRVVTRTTTTTEHVVEHVSSRSLTILVNRQTKAFNRLIDDLRQLTALEGAILLTLAESGEVWTADRLARSLDCTVKWAAQLANGLVKTGLVVRPDGQTRVYRGNAIRHLGDQFPDLDASALFKRVVAVLA